MIYIYICVCVCVCVCVCINTNMIDFVCFFQHNDNWKSQNNIKHRIIDMVHTQLEAWPGSDT